MQSLGGALAWPNPYACPPNVHSLQVIVEKRDLEKDEFVVLACDGIWDVMSSQAVVDKVRDLLMNGRPPAPTPPPQVQHPNGAAVAPPQPQEKRPWDLGAVCEELIDHCLALGSRDNMSVVLVILNPAFKPKPETAS
jgi:serine/threonine protein phosphatase PrpC